MLYKTFIWHNKTIAGQDKIFYTFTKRYVGSQQLRDDNRCLIYCLKQQNNSRQYVLVVNAI